MMFVFERIANVFLTDFQMLSEVECRALAEHYLSGLAQEMGDKLELVHAPLETSATLAYFYQTSAYVVTGDFRYALGGN